MPQHDAVIVGAGLAGLCCARRLHEAGRSVLVLEAADAVGGRVRTDEVEGFLLDRGFQVLLTAYPEARRVLDYAALDLQALYPGALVRMDGAFHRVADPLRAPAAALPTAFGPVGTLADKLRVLRLRRSVTAPTLDALWAREEVPTREALRERYGFSGGMVQRFFEPFFGGIFLEEALATSSRAFEFYFRMFARGETAVPARGMQRIPEQIAAGLPEGSIRLNVPVRSVGPGAVVLRTGERVEAHAVVLATDAWALPALLDGTGVELEPPAPNGTVCLYYAAPEPPHADPVLVLNGDRTGVVNEVVVMSNVARRYAPPGQALVSISVVDVPALDDGEVERRARAQLRSWYGAAVAAWRHLRTYRIPHALPAQPPPALSPPRRSPRLVDGLFVCGDHRADASINGAMLSGRLAAEAVIAEAP